MKIKEVTIYECSDGKRFDDKADAEKYNRILCEVNDIMAPLGEKPDDYHSITHQKEVVEKTLAHLMKLCADTITDFDMSFKETTINDCYGCLTGRVLSDCSGDYPCLYKAYHRFMCINPTSFIEYDQPYWAKHEEEYNKTIEQYRKKGLL